MPLNLISDQWIPVIQNGQRTIIRPSQIAEKDIEQLCWPRSDFNLACMELLIGLVFLTDPVRSERDWNERFQEPDADRLQNSLDPFSNYFELTGDGYRFLQDLEQFEKEINKNNIKPTEMLFIDSAGNQTRKNNSDIMVHRDRYNNLPLPLAAMALYTLQAFAPAGGAGNRTSMRGGGPMVTILQPTEKIEYLLWRTILLNVPEGTPLPANRASEALPWLRPTRTSEKNQIVTPEQSHKAEMFFGMPRRLRLVEQVNHIVGYVQKPYGTNYANWNHYLSPYYRKEPGVELLAVHPKPGKISYQNWLGVTIHHEIDKKQIVADSVKRYHDSSSPPLYPLELQVGGWAMKNMTPLDFSVHVYPTFGITNRDSEERINNLIKSANESAKSLVRALKESLNFQGSRTERVREDFFEKTENQFISSVSLIIGGRNQKNQPEEDWLKTLKNTAINIFDELTHNSLSDMSIRDIAEIVNQRKSLFNHFSSPKKIRKTLDLEKVGKGVE